ncbi:GNAT family N-acetyltransferase [Gordonia sp. SID5947]|uniref:GNAT family N-acetyltransferase n=1 Tax=Gordonia sp. SID5947 TaxID=2690315 RepID=UPI001369AD0B|nr:GNAT family N-acetyltransferase [Gordonia sp. SID5947]
MPVEAVIETVTDPAQAGAVAEVAAATFPLACPPHSTADDIAGFIRENLHPERFADHIHSPDSDVLTARDGIAGPIVGYALIHHCAPTHPDVAAVVTERPVTEISKMYVAPTHHALGRGTPPSHALMRAALDLARERGSVLAWLGVNQENVRAQRFYAKMGFTRVGVKTFDLNGSIEHDFILAQPLT